MTDTERDRMVEVAMKATSNTNNRQWSAEEWGEDAQAHGHQRSQWPGWATANAVADALLAAGIRPCDGHHWRTTTPEEEATEHGW